MPDLLERQRDVAGALCDPLAAARAARWLDGAAALNERRLAIHRDNAAAAVSKALSAAYPVIRRFVGAAHFEEITAAYGRASPSASGDLHDFGATFPAFIAGHDVALRMPGLPDLARLEWAVHCAYGAADAAPFDAAGLARVPAQRQSTVCFVWAPGTALIASAYPIARVWQVHQPDFEGDVGVEEAAGETALVAREGLQVAVHAVAPGDAAFIAASLGGATLEAAVARALETDPRFDPGRLLTRWIAAGTICGFTDEEDH